MQSQVKPTRLLNDKAGYRKENCRNSFSSCTCWSFKGDMEYKNFGENFFIGWFIISPNYVFHNFWPKVFPEANNKNCLQ